jgi:hypothetical protein
MQTKDPPKRGRSTGYGAEIAETICLRLIAGESLRAICADPRMPAKATVCRWLARNKEFRRWYALARGFQADFLADEILEIVDGCSGDCVEKVLRDGKVVMVPNDENIRRARVRIGARKLAAARMTPRKYGYR